MAKFLCSSAAQDSSLRSRMTRGTFAGIKPVRHPRGSAGVPETSVRVLGFAATRPKDLARSTN